MKRGIRFLLLKARVSWLFFRLLSIQSVPLATLFRTWHKILSNLKSTGEFPFVKKFFYHEGKYYWDLYFPGFPSGSFDYALEQVIAGAARSGTGDLWLLFVAITKKCGLQCEHCFEWEEINKPEILTEERIHDNLSYYFKDGCFGQLFISGGEPMSRYVLLHSLVRAFGDNAECWVISSGTGFSSMRAKELKQAGLTGVVISLDSHHANAHDEFRGMPGTHARALAAVKNAQEANLLTSLSLCPSKGTLNREFLDGYMDLARQLKVSFVQILEPRTEGRYRDLDITLEFSQIRLLEQFQIEYNTQKKYRAYPRILYPDYNKRLIGCRGMVSHAYLDTNGSVHPCPFCKQGDGKCGFEYSADKLAVGGGEGERENR